MATWRPWPAPSHDAHTAALHDLTARGLLSREVLGRLQEDGPHLARTRALVRNLVDMHIQPIIDPRADRPYNGEVHFDGPK
jgi:hypothetical protein